MKIKTAELTGPALDWAVALAEGHKPPMLRVLRGNVVLPDIDDPMVCDYLDYSTDWAPGGPIIERMFEEGFQLSQGGLKAGNQRCWASRNGQFWSGPTPLIAAMRCYVASRLGAEVDIPEKLLS